MDGGKRTLSRTATVAALLAGLVLGALWQPAGAQGKPTPPAPRTAYVEFLKLLKEDAKFERERIKIGILLQQSLRDIRDEYTPEITRLRKNRDSYNPDTPEYYRAMNQLTDKIGKLAYEEISAESQAKRSMKKKGIAAFRRLRALVRDIAAEQGYTQVLNIARDPDKAIESQMDFQALQKELLLSPVLYFDEKHDLTKVVLEEADKRWGKHIKLKVNAQDEKGVLVARLAANKDKVDYDVKVGEKLRLVVEVTDKGKPAEGKAKKHSAEVRGIGALGAINRLAAGSDIWVYTAPVAVPGEPIVEIRFRSSDDPSVKSDVRVRVVKKED